MNVQTPIDTASDSTSLVIFEKRYGLADLFREGAAAARHAVRHVAISY